VFVVRLLYINDGVSVRARRLGTGAHVRDDDFRGAGVRGALPLAVVSRLGNQ